MTDYYQKYYKYKQKYTDLKEQLGGVKNGLQTIPIINQHIEPFLGCKSFIKSISTDKKRINIIDWELINSKDKIDRKTQYDINLNGHKNKICTFIDNSRSDYELQSNHCNEYINKCRLDDLHKKYIPNERTPNIYTIEILNKIILWTIPNNTMENRTNDINFLKSLGGKIPIIINNSIFYNSNLTNIMIPDFVKIISENAFQHNNLTNVIIPNSVISIYDYAFDHNKLYNLIIPNSIKNIGSYAFSNNELINVTIPNSIKIINKYSFYNNKLTTLTIPNSVTTIGKNAFENNRLIEITIPNSVTTIGELAFANNNLINVTLPEKLKNDINKIFGSSIQQNITFTYT
jgi:hypothetical protein